MSSTPINLNEFGLNEVASATDPQIDIVFVHGLNGHPYDTWATHKPDIFWPADLLPADVDQERCRILSYGYDAKVGTFTDGASKDHIHNHAEHLAARLHANRSRKRALERPLVFVCHSLGGLVVKRMLIYCRGIDNHHQEHLRAIYVSTSGILFLGTPHNGSDLSKWGTLLQSICAATLPKKIFDSSSQLVKDLESNNETLQVINRQFTDIVNRFDIYFFHESKPTDLKGTLRFVVDEDSAAPNVQGVERMGIERDHRNMCKFESENSPGYDVVSEAVQRYARNAFAKIPARWIQEKRIRSIERQAAARDILGADFYPHHPESSDMTGRSQGASLGAPLPHRMLTADESSSSVPFEIEEVEVPTQLR